MDDINNSGSFEAESVDVNGIVEQLDLLSQDIMQVLVEKCDGASNTSELKSLLQVDNNDKLLYRYREKLVPLGLVEVEQPELENGSMPPKMVVVTSLGERVGRVVGEVSGGRSSDGSVRERLERVERLVEGVSDDVESLERSVGLLVVALGLGGVGDEQSLPSVLALRAGFTGVDDAVGELSNGDVDVNDFVAKWASDEFRELDDEVSELEGVVAKVRGDVDSLKSVEGVDGVGGSGGGGL